MSALYREHRPIAAFDIEDIERTRVTPGLRSQTGFSLSRTIYSRP